ncbi:hypothetical protein MXD61_10665 [Frankia sp. AgPm24]|uniref:hypothetical protein n=1 Tax=Frankia sp. AgPm24 TaxID=631128 RepID=UPI00200E42A4|nr:hypothetical protein [Frankia sp. AgPm24]MCK9922331.1 hypothetical protein [Frankia sp. AgPm24]
MRKHDITVDFGPDAEAAIAASARQFSNWNRWGADDARGAVNFLDAKPRAEAANLIRVGTRSTSPSPSTNTAPSSAGSAG